MNNPDLRSTSNAGELEEKNIVRNNHADLPKYGSNSSLPKIDLNLELAKKWTYKFRIHKRFFGTRRQVADGIKFVRCSLALHGSILFWVGAWGICTLNAGRRVRWDRNSHQFVDG